MVRDLNIAVSPGKGPAYLKVAHALREALQRKILRPGEALPSSRRLAEMTGLHRQTVMAALEELIAEGWIVSDLRKCYRVSGTLPTEFFEATAGSESTSVGKEFEWKLPPSLPEVLSPPSGVLRHSFQSGLSDVRLFPRREFKSCWQDSFLRSGTDVLGARNGAGQPFFLETLDLYLRRVRRLSGRHIIATHGSQEGIYIAARLLLKKDDRVAIEALGYPSAWGVFQSVGAALEPIPLDTAGLDVDSPGQPGPSRLRHLSLNFFQSPVSRCTARVPGRPPRNRRAGAPLQAPDNGTHRSDSSGNRGTMDCVRWV